MIFRLFLLTKVIIYDNLLTCEKRIAAITRLRDEAGAITAEQADKMIEDAKKEAGK